MALLKHSLNYVPHPLSLFERLSHLPWQMLLDSGKPQGQQGRYDILVAAPVITLKTLQNPKGQFYTEVCQAGHTHITYEDPFLVLRALLRDYMVKSEPGVLFAGGAVGYWAYDLARYLVSLPNVVQSCAQLPHMLIGIYDWAVVIDHLHQETQLLSYGLYAQTRRDWPALCALLSDVSPKTERRTHFAVRSAVNYHCTPSAYHAAFQKIQTHISAGDCYQVNLAQRFSVQATGDAWLAYQKLRDLSAAPFMAYINAADVQVLSASPERFLAVRDGLVQTCPIKGTRPRALTDAKRDQQLINDLQNSEKDRAENLMIVDLLRNDLGKTCMPGSIRVHKLFQVYSYTNVHHLVSIIEGQLAAHQTAIDVLRNAFPGGSITGAPKLATMRIIESLETHRRGVYCGAIGYVGFDGNMDTNIAIRTAVYLHGELSAYAGGGIVSDSDVHDEYTETLDKAKHLLDLMRYFSG